MEKAVIKVGILSLLLTTSAYAACPTPCGWYMDGNFGYTQVSDTDFGSGSSTSNNGGGINIDWGAKFSRFFATEIGLTKYSDIKILNAAGTQAAKDQYFSYDFVGKGMLPLAMTGIDLYAKLGIARINSKISVSNGPAAAGLGLSSGTTTATGIYFGVGIQYEFMSRMPVMFQWMRAKGNSITGNIDLISIGVGYIY